jgi:hypothetical protein
VGSEPDEESREGSMTEAELTHIFVMKREVFVVFLLGSFAMFMVTNIVNEGFMRLLQDLAAANARSGSSRSMIERLGATGAGGGGSSHLGPHRWAAGPPWPGARGCA